MLKNIEKYIKKAMFLCKLSERVQLGERGMINSDRILNEFLKMAIIESPTRDERKMADTLKVELEQLGFSVTEDDAGKAIGGNTGNLFAVRKGGIPGDPLLLCAHMDTVKPVTGKYALVEGDTIRSGGDTVLGADDLAGVVEILEAVRSVDEDAKPCRDLEILFTVSEEFFLKGAENFDASKCRAKEAYILDVDGDIGTAVLAAPTGIRFIANVKGKSAHAAIAPEEGINAIAIAAKAISDMRLGRIDRETTASIGIIKGGEQGNIVPDSCFVEGETRSLSSKKATTQCRHMQECFENAAVELGGSVSFEITKVYDAYGVSEDSAVVRRFKNACKTVGIEPKLTSSTGGSDNSVLSQKGLQGIVVACGMHEIHSVNEYTKLSELTAMAKVVEQMITSEE